MMRNIKEYNQRGAMHTKLTLTALLAILTLTIIPFSTGFIGNANASPQPNSSVAGPVQTSLPEEGSVGKLQVFVGRSMVVQSGKPLKRVSVTDPDIASTIVVSPTQLMIHGLKPGTVSLLLWDPQERMQTFDLQVQIDTRPISSRLKQVFPNENIMVAHLGSALVLNGEVSNQEVIDKSVALAQTQAPSVVSTMWVKPPSRETIMLKVRFAEVDRSAVQELGVNFFSTGAGNTIGSVTTQQFGGGFSTNSGAIPAGVEGGSQPEGSSVVAGGIPRGLAQTPSAFGLNDLLNIFIFRSDVNMGMVIRALQQKNLLQILAEPDLLATNGQEASFLAGGEFPFPIVQSGTGSTSLSIEFKEFGIRLKFLANVLEDGKIRLKVAPEVSALDYANALTVSGFLIPALTSRRAETEVELSDGQSFAIAGLMDNRITDVISKVPGLGDIPILGNLFKSKGLNKSKTELMVMVTPTVVQPLEPDQEPPLPEFPEPFLDIKSFDKKKTGNDGPANTK